MFCRKLWTNLSFKTQVITKPAPKFFLLPMEQQYTQKTLDALHFRFFLENSKGIQSVARPTTSGFNKHVAQLFPDWSPRGHWKSGQKKICLRIHYKRGSKFRYIFEITDSREIDVWGGFPETCGTCGM